MPAGFGPAGLGTPVTAEERPEGAVGSRYLNPATRDYQQDTTTRQLAQMPGVRQRVLLTVLTLVRSSSTLPGFGVPLPRKMGDQFQSQITNAVRGALRQMTEVERVMRIDGVVAERGSGGRARITISFTDLTTDESDTLEF